jgi:hypothetical protein
MMAWESKGMRGIASSLNPAAGMHPVTMDPEEIAAAERAGEKSIAEFPYYVERYGESARRFGLSDGAWMVTLCSGRDDEMIVREIEWLWRVLAPRGMPGLLLERHLSVLRGELTEARPEDSERYGRLEIGEDFLRRRRTAVLPEDALREIAERFARSVDPDLNDRLPRMGEILCAAVADEGAGVERAVRSVLTWAADPRLFPAGWIDAARAAVAEARERRIS